MTECTELQFQRWLADLVDREEGWCPSQEDSRRLVAINEPDGLKKLSMAAASVRDRGSPDVVSYSRKVFVPLTQLCRDVCHYCTFAHPPREDEPAFLSLDQVLQIAQAGAQAGCREALFTLGDKPELRYRKARRELNALGHGSTLSYLAEAAKVVHQETGLLPHFNPGLLTESDFKTLRPFAPSMGVMLETTSSRLSETGGPHFGSPDKEPALRLSMLEAAGRAAVPFTTGILIGIGETRLERIEALTAIRDADNRYGHIQEVIIQNFCPKPGTRMANAPASSETELVWTIAVARLLLGGKANIQAPPNLSPGRLEQLLGAGLNDWGGVSPVTPDHVNPEFAWPQLDTLAKETERAGKTLVERLAVYPDYVLDADRWIDPSLHQIVLRASDASGLARGDDWIAGVSTKPANSWQSKRRRATRSTLDAVLNRAERGERLEETQILQLFDARGGAVGEVCSVADDLRQRTVGDEVTYVVNRNINYTNICNYRCQFCAFSKGKTADYLRGKPYNLNHDEIWRRTVEAAERGATEVCLQGGIHPEYTGNTYLNICRTVREAAPDIHIHAFSPLEIMHGAETLNVSIPAFLEQLRDAGLNSLPGTAAEILDDEVRAIICPDKLRTDEWLYVISAAHKIGLPTTSTMMFGHVDRPQHWARHLLRLRDLQSITGGIMEFVPLPFVGQEAPIYLKGKARPGPTFREAVLVHAVARLVLSPLIKNIQTSWVKMGPRGALVCLNSGANDFGGILMDESITRAAGASHGQELDGEAMSELVKSIGRKLRQRTTDYGQRDDSCAYPELYASRQRKRTVRPDRTDGTFIQ